MAFIASAFITVPGLAAQREIQMFTYKQGEVVEASQKKARLRSAAKKEWPFLTSLELADVGSEWQLTNLVRSSTGRTEAEATQVVRSWMERQKMRPDIGSGATARRPLADWEAEGGAII